MKKQHIPLLETLQKAKVCVYLSDLRFLPLAEIRPEIEKLRPETFSLHEWEDAVEYLTHQAKTFQNAGEARSFLLHDKGKGDRDYERRTAPYGTGY